MPDCEPCHECYFQWFDLISYAAMRVSSLRARAELLTTTHYNGHNASSIEGALTAVLLQLETASSTLASITLNTTDIDRLGESLQQVRCMTAHWFRVDVVCRLRKRCLSLTDKLPSLRTSWLLHKPCWITSIALMGL